MCLAGYVCCLQEKHQSISSDQVTNILDLSYQLAGEDTVRITRQPVQVTSRRSEPGHNNLYVQVQDVIGGQSQTGPEVTPFGGICGRRHAGAGVTGRVKNTGNTGGDTEFGEWRGGEDIRGDPCYYAGEYPWHAAILKREELDNLYVCGGSLVRGDIILTAAHCVDKYTETQLRSEQHTV